MSDDFNDTLPVSPPSEPATSIDPASEVVTERRHAALSQLAKSENIEGYAQEREDQAAAIDRGEEISEQRKGQWYRRAHKALTDAANEAAGIKTADQDEQQAAPPEYDPTEEAQSRDYARKEGAAQVRVQQYFGNNEERKQQIIEWHAAMDPESKVASWIIENESQFAPQIMERLADNPEALQQLASMPANQRDRWLGALEGHIAAQTNFAQQVAQQQQHQWQQQRRVSKAPPPISSPRGGANPPSDLHQLASRGEDVSSYVKARQQQERRRD